MKKKLTPEEIEAINKARAERKKYQPTKADEDAAHERVKKALGDVYLTPEQMEELHNKSVAAGKITAKDKAEAFETKLKNQAIIKQTPAEKKEILNKSRSEYKRWNMTKEEVEEELDKLMAKILGAKDKDEAQKYLLQMRAMREENQQ